MTLSSVIVHAEDKAPTASASSESAVSASPSLDPEICQFFSTYVPADDVDYKPGVDVDGHSVPEADVENEYFKKPDGISFNITLDAAKYMGITVPNDAVEVNGTIGTVMYQSGAFTFNGQPLSKDSESSMKSLCGAHPQQAPAAVPTPEPSTETPKTP